MPLSLRFVREIHARLAVRYGCGWAAKWAGFDISAVEADWAAELDGMTPEGIRKALASLPPDFPPTSGAFREAGAIRVEAAAPLALPEPSNPEVAEQALRSMRAVGKPSPAEWMARLDADVRAGIASRVWMQHHRIATENGYFANAQSRIEGDFTAIPRDKWPAGMQAPAIAQRIPSKRLAEEFQ